jgi:molecular chaperone GrpE
VPDEMQHPDHDAHEPAAEPAAGGPTADEVASAYGVPAGEPASPEELAAAIAKMAKMAETAGADGATAPSAALDLDALEQDDHSDTATLDSEARIAEAELRASEQGLTAGMLMVALEDSTIQREEYLDSLLRSRAEFDNFRRRTTREAAGARQAGMGDLAAKFLDVLDDLDRTSEVAAASDDSGLAGGVQAVQRKFVDTLTGAGIERLDAVEVPFDAARHEAVQQVPADEPGAEPVVATILRPGYLLGARVLRAAMVVVRQ